MKMCLMSILRIQEWKLVQSLGFARRLCYTDYIYFIMFSHKRTIWTPIINEIYILLCFGLLEKIPVSFYKANDLTFLCLQKNVCM